MHDFTIVVLLSLALWKVVDLLEELVPGLTKIHTLLTVALGVAGAVFMDYSMFRGFHVVLRYTYMGPWATGFAIAGTTSAWRALFHWFGSSEGDAPEVRHASHGPRRMAA
ncbi:MAG: hypothetical protein ACYDH6_11715 [Acidimicrobiales bacterium]